VIQASRYASFSGRSSAAQSDTRRPVFGTQKRNARFSTRNSASCQPQSSVGTPSETERLEAFEKMAVVSRPKFLAIAKAILRNREDAEDAVQNALLSGYLHLPSFEGRSALTTWFTRILVNAALVIRRKQKFSWMRPQTETDFSNDAKRMERIRSSQPDPEMVYAESEIFQVINDVLGKMSPTLRHAFTTTYYDEMSAPEARVLLGVSSAAFKSRVLRARRQVVNQVQRIRVAPMRSTAPSSVDKNFFQPLAVRKPETGLLEVSLS
jgi:RNA polymerase sigma-70 factor (ECF subfamily)